MREDTRNVISLQLLPMCMIIIIVAMPEKQGAIFKLQRRYLEFKILIIFT